MARRPGRALLTSVDVELGLTALAAMLSPTTLTFSVLALVLSERPGRTGLWFFLGAFGATLVVGVIAPCVLGSAAASPGKSSEPKTWVAIVDVVAGVLLLVYVVRALRCPRVANRLANAMSEDEQGLVVAGGRDRRGQRDARQPRRFFPLALKDISQLRPTTAGFIALWLALAVISLLPPLAALIALGASRDWAVARLQAARRWLERNARTMAAVIVVLVAAALLRNGIVGSRANSSKRDATRATRINGRFDASAGGGLLLLRLHHEANKQEQVADGSLGDEAGMRFEAEAAL